MFWGFAISDSVGMMQAWLYIPAFTKGKDQLWKYMMCMLPIDFINKHVGEKCPLIDRIVRVSCTLNKVVTLILFFIVKNLSKFLHTRYNM